MNLPIMGGKLIERLMFTHAAAGGGSRGKEVHQGGEEGVVKE
jgi:hypothetical protein